jgi:hypothetical protein
MALDLTKVITLLFTKYTLLYGMGLLIVFPDLGISSKLISTLEAGEGLRGDAVKFFLEF